MGISDRDYYHDERPSGPMSSYGAPSAIKALLVINVLLFFAQALTMGRGGEPIQSPIAGALEVELSLVASGQVWRLLTCGFIHADLMHIAFNMLVLWMFGSRIESDLGTREFLALYLIGIVIASLGHCLYQAATGSIAPALGASGGVSAIVLATAVRYPRAEVLFLMFIPMRMWVLGVIVVMIDVVGLGNTGDRVARAAHLAGAAWGAAYSYFRWNITDGFSRWAARRNARRRDRQIAAKAKKRKLGIYQPPEDLESRADEILAKITSEGETSLTEEERKILEDASRHYKTKSKDE